MAVWCSLRTGTEKEQRVLQSSCKMEKGPDKPVRELSPSPGCELMD